MSDDLKPYAPDFLGEHWLPHERQLLEPFATNLDGFVSVLRNLPPEIVGALCSRASRASGSLLRILLKEYLVPIVEGEDATLAEELLDTIEFLNTKGFRNVLNNQRAQAFYAKWLSQYGDDSIAQMTGTHMVFWGISQVAMKFLEDQRIGLEPIEKSTRYVNFAHKIDGTYLYYTPKPDLEPLGLLEEYRSTMDNLFDTYVTLLPKLVSWLKENFNDKDSVLEKKAFDTLRGLLPMATLGQVAFRGNAQAFEYLINRSRQHPLGELRWIAASVKEQLDQEIPSLLLRVADEKSGDYQAHLASRKAHVREWVKTKGAIAESPAAAPSVKLVEWDPEAETKIAAAILFPELHCSWHRALDVVRGMDISARRQLFARYLSGRKARWYKVGRALESSYVRFEIVMNIGSYRDLHRHRMMSQDRQQFSTRHGYDVPPELIEAKLDAPFRGALEEAAKLFEKIEPHDSQLAQYVVPLAYRMRLYQWQNFRQLFWEAELRSISQGHPDYRAVEHAKYAVMKEKFPLIAEFLQVDTNDYAIARRGTEEKIQQKEQELIEKLSQVRQI